MPQAVYALAFALAAVIGRWPGPYSPPDRAEDARAQRAAWVVKVADALAQASGEVKWPGRPDELAALTATLGYFESRLDERIQSGHCAAWGPSPSNIECDGVLFRSGVRPPRLTGLELKTRWGLVVFTSSTMFQFKGLSQERIEAFVGVEPDNLLESARHAMRLLSGFRSGCRSGAWELCTISAYAGTISYRQAPARAAWFRKTLAELRSARQAAPAQAAAEGSAG